MAAISPPPLAGEPAQPVMPSPSWVRKALSERLNSAAMACSSASLHSGPNTTMEGLPRRVLAEGIDMKQSGHRQILRGRKAQEGDLQGHFYTTAGESLRRIFGFINS